MYIDQYRRAVNSLDKEIAELEKKKAAKDKEIADLQNKINSVQKSITSHSLQSTVNSKMRQIASYESDKAKKSKDSAELGKKIADKRKKRSEAYLKLQKEQQNEQKKQDRANQRLQASYESRIEELQRQLVESVVSPQQRSVESEEYDVFVSHAYEDKKDFVDELVEEFKKLGLKVWYDRDKLKMQTANKADEILKKLAAMFPNAVMGTIDENGEVVRSILEAKENTMIYGLGE